MPSYITHRNKNAVIVLALLVLALFSCTVLSGCCRKQYTQHHSSIVLDSIKTNKIDTYIFKGIKHYVYDTTVIVVNTTGDTVRTDHKSDSRYYQENERQQDTTYIERVRQDTVIVTQDVIVKNELNKTQKFFVWWGVGVMVAILGYLLYKIFILFRV